MTQQRVPTIVRVSLNQTGPLVVPLDYRFSGVQNRSIAASITAGDTLTVYVCPCPADVNAKVNILGTDQLAPTSAGLYVQSHLSTFNGLFFKVSAYTASFVDVIEGPWAQLKVVKTGTNGSALFYIVG